MVELIEANWIVLVIALVIGVLVAWWVFVSSRRTKVEIEPRDDAAQEPRTRRNQALIDAPPAAAQPAPSVGLARSPEIPERVIPPATPMGLAGVGEAVQAAAEPELKPAPHPEPEPEPEPETYFVAPADGSDPAQDLPAAIIPPAPDTAPGEDLTRIKGLGPKIQVRLGELGVTRLAQIAAWDEAEIDRIDAQLERFQGRIRRDAWVEQARLLSGGDTAQYEDRFGKL